MVSSCTETVSGEPPVKRAELEIDLVVQTWDSLPESHPLRERLLDIWHKAAFSGYIRGEIEDVTIETEWKWAVQVCKELHRVSAQIQ
jgi:hypothetical protein